MKEVIPMKKELLIRPKSSVIYHIEPTRDKDLVSVRLTSLSPNNLTHINFKIGGSVITTQNNLEENLFKDAMVDDNFGLPLFLSCYFYSDIEFVYDIPNYYTAEHEEDEYKTELMYHSSDEEELFFDTEKQEFRKGIRAYEHKIKTGNKVMNEVYGNEVIVPEITMEWRDSRYKPQDGIIEIPIWQPFTIPKECDYKQRLLDEGRMEIIDAERARFKNVLVFRYNTAGLRYSF